MFVVHSLHRLVLKVYGLSEIVRFALGADCQDNLLIHYALPRKTFEGSSSFLGRPHINTSGPDRRLCDTIKGDGDTFHIEASKKSVNSDGSDLSGQITEQELTFLFCRLPRSFANRCNDFDRS